MNWTASSKEVYEGIPHSEYLDQFESEDYQIRKGLSFDGDATELGGAVLYHVINKHTDVVEYQGQFLCSTIESMKMLQARLTALVLDNKQQLAPRLIN